MTDNSFPLVPSPELVQQWDTEGYHQDYCSPFEYAIAQAARWGSNQELEACCEWLKGTAHIGIDFELLHARRPQPPSLKEQALALVEQHEDGWRPSPHRLNWCSSGLAPTSAPLLLVK